MPTDVNALKSQGTLSSCFPESLRLRQAPVGSATAGTPLTPGSTAASTSALVADITNPCAFLTPAEVESAFGVPVQAQGDKDQQRMFMFCDYLTVEAPNKRLLTFSLTTAQKTGIDMAGLFETGKKTAATTPA